jgi:hypothetical protein
MSETQPDNLIERIAEAFRKRCEQPGSFRWAEDHVYRELAQIAVKLIREPTQTMIRAGDRESDHDGESICAIWRAMVDALLEGTAERAREAVEDGSPPKPEGELRR